MSMFRTLVQMFACPWALRRCFASPPWTDIDPWVTTLGVSLSCLLGTLSRCVTCLGFHHLLMSQLFRLVSKPWKSQNKFHLLLPLCLSGCHSVTKEIRFIWPDLIFRKPCQVLPSILFSSRYCKLIWSIF